MAALTAISAIAGIVGTAVSAAGTLAAGEQAQASAEFEAKQREQQAGQERAIAQRDALERRREQKLLQSAQLARAAAVGGAADPSVLDIFADTAEAGELNVQTEIAEGENRAKGLELAAEVRRIEGRQAKQASRIAAGSAILGGVSTLFTRFGKSRSRPLANPSGSGVYYGGPR